MDFSKFGDVLMVIWPCLLATAIGGWILGKLMGSGPKINIADWEGKLNASNGLVTERDGTIKTLRADMDGLKGKLTDAEGKLSATTNLDGELTSLRAQLADHEKNCQATISAKDGEITALRDQLSTAVKEANDRITEANRQIAEANSRTAATAAASALAGAATGAVASQAVSASQSFSAPQPSVEQPIASQAVAPTHTDDLLEIVGVGPVLNKQLNDHGITTFKQIGEWSNADVDAFEAKMENFHGRVERENWVIQARELHLKKYGEHITGTWKPTASQVIYAEQDDLEEIVGVGPVLAKLLHDNGVHTFRQVARWTSMDINKMQDQIEGFGDRIERENWVGQSRDLHQKKYGERI
jgi:predicted flap endonuclease-1-like 5' DNA nuclease